MTLRNAARVAYLLVLWLFVACLVGQVFLAGLGVFDDARNFATHREFGYLFGWLTIILVVLALVGRLPRPIVGWSVLMLGLFALQSVLVAVRSGAPAVAALHPLNGFLILLVALGVARRARGFVPVPLGTATGAGTVRDPASLPATDA